MYDQSLEAYIRQQGLAPGVETCVITHAHESLAMEDVNTYFQSGGRVGGRKAEVWCSRRDTAESVKVSA